MANSNFISPGISFLDSQAVGIIHPVASEAVAGGDGVLLVRLYFVVSE